MTRHVTRRRERKGETGIEGDGRGGEGERGRECVCVCVCVRERERERRGGHIYMLDRVQLHTVMTHDAPIDLHTVKTI